MAPPQSGLPASKSVECQLSDRLDLHRQTSEHLGATPKSFLAACLISSGTVVNCFFLARVKVTPLCVV